MLKLPVHEILGGMTRNYCECYNTGGILPGIKPGMTLKERAAATVAAGYRAFRMGAADTPSNTTFNTSQKVNQLYEECVQVREGVGKDGDFCIDFHQRFDLSDAVRGCDLIENLAPFFVEDPVRAEAFGEDLPRLRRLVRVPIAAGEEWGNRWDFNILVENHDIDYLRATLPNVGGITEMMKIAAICETHFVGIVPHFTGPIATAALVNSLGTFSGPLLIEYGYEGKDLPICQSAWILRTESYIQTTSRGSASSWTSQQADPDHGSNQIRNESSADVLSSGQIDYKLVVRKCRDESQRDAR